MYIPDKQSTEIRKCEKCGKPFTYTRQTTVAGPIVPTLPPKYCPLCRVKRIFGK